MSLNDWVKIDITEHCYNDWMKVTDRMALDVDLDVDVDVDVDLDVLCGGMRCLMDPTWPLPTTA